MNYRTNKRNSIELSLKDKNYNGEQNYQFTEQKNILYTSLETTFREYNYSPILWRNNYRRQENFLYATGFIVDIDEGMTIQEAEEILKKHKLNYALITSKSHSEDLHKFHILIPFSRKIYTLENYKAVCLSIKEELFPSLDTNTLDGARYMFGSNETSTFTSYFNGQDFQVDKDIQVSEAWNDDFEVTLKDGETKAAMEIVNQDQETVPIHCPFHHDGSPSAFISYSQTSFNHFIRCSTCGRTYWKVQTRDNLDVSCNKYWSFNTSVYEAGIVNDEFSLENISEKKFYVKVNAYSKEDKQKYFSYLVKNKHLHRISSINNIGSIDVDESTYECDQKSGIITVKLKALPIKVQDNDFIENYLESVFGMHKDFMKKWMAVYVYTNYKKLPTLLLTGDRGVGKNTFAESIQAIFPTLSEIAKDLDGNFTPFAEKKLLIIDESASNGKIQYQMLKKFSGQKSLEVNKKYLQQYQVLNNLNIILLSNDELPIYVERDEAPTDERNNQFFVYRMQPHKAFDATLQEKIIQRLGYYIRTELKVVFDTLNMDEYRYSIPVPITDEENKLFNNSITDIEAEADRIVEVFETHMNRVSWPYYKFVKEGYIPTDFFHGLFDNYKVKKTKVIQNLQKRKYIANEKSEKHMVDGDRKYCYKLGQIWLDMLKRVPVAESIDRQFDRRSLFDKAA